MTISRLFSFLATIYFIAPSLYGSSAPNVKSQVEARPTVGHLVQSSSGASVPVTPLARAGLASARAAVPLATASRVISDLDTQINALVEAIRKGRFVVANCRNCCGKGSSIIYYSEQDDDFGAGFGLENGFNNADCLGLEDGVVNPQSLGLEVIVDENTISRDTEKKLPAEISRPKDKKTLYWCDMKRLDMKQLLNSSTKMTVSKRDRYYIIECSSCIVHVDSNECDVDHITDNECCIEPKIPYQNKKFFLYNSFKKGSGFIKSPSEAIIAK